MSYKILNKNKKQIIKVTDFYDTNKAILSFYEENKKIFDTEAFIGKNGITYNKIEGDGKTPLGSYKLGLIFGIHNKSSIGLLDKDMLYIKITENLYWVDDIKSKYYNQLVDINKVIKDWDTAEHLIEYPKQYEYAIEIKANSANISGKR